MKTIGIDLGGRDIRMAEVHGRRVVRTASIPRRQETFDHEEGRRLCQALYRHAFSDAELVVGAPSDLVRFEVLSLPPVESGAPVDQIVRMEMARMHRLDPGSFECAMWPIPIEARDGSHQAAAVACAHEDTDTIVESIEQHGRRVRVLDVESHALARLLLDDEPTLVVDIGWDRLLVVAVHSRIAVYERRLNEQGLEVLHQTVAKSLRIGDAETDHVMAHHAFETREGIPCLLDHRVAARRVDACVRALVKEIETSLAYAEQRFGEMSRVVISGDGAAVAGIAPLLEGRLHLPVRPMTPSESLRCDDRALGHGTNAGFSLAIGYGLHS